MKTHLLLIPIAVICMHFMAICTGAIFQLMHTASIDMQTDNTSMQIAAICMDANFQLIYAASIGMQTAATCMQIATICIGDNFQLMHTASMSMQIIATCINIVVVFVQMALVQYIGCRYLLNEVNIASTVRIYFMLCFVSMNIYRA